MAMTFPNSDGCTGRGSTRAGLPGVEHGSGYSGWIRSLTIQCLLYVYGRTSGFQRPMSEVSFYRFDIGRSVFSTSYAQR